jgi:hypothetical protein
MKRLLPILFLVFTLTSRAGGGLSSIQAVCRAITADGKVHEGFITLLSGCCNGVHPNGFYFYQDDHYQYTEFFDLGFKKLERTNPGKYRIGGHTPEAKEVSFLTYTSDLQWLDESRQTVSDSTGQYLLTKTQVQRKYLKSDKLILFTELPMFLFIDYKDKANRIEIPMKDLVSFEILLEPGEKWLQEIKNKRKACFEIVNSDESTGDYMEPIWAHEMVRDTEIFKYWKEYVEEWYRE